MPTLGVIWAGIKIALNILAQLLTGQAAQATSDDVSLVKTIVTNVELQLINLTYGLDAAYAQRVDILSRLTILQASIDAVPTGTQLAANPVILPTTAPSGYGGADASDVWNYVQGGASRSQGYYMVDAGQLGLAMSGGNGLSFPTYNRPGWTIGGNWSDPAQPSPVLSLVEAVDPSTILATDATYSDWLTRAYPGLSYYLDDSGHAVADQFYNSSWLFRLEFGPAEFATYQAALLAAPATLLLPPIWPGLALVTLGTNIPFTTDDDLAGPMDGILVNISGVPTKTSFFAFGATHSYRNLGAIAFVNDDGWTEAYQLLGFEDAIYMPKMMVRAASAHVRIVGGVVADVTPFTIT